MADTGDKSVCLWIGRLPAGLRREQLADVFRALPGYYGTVLREGRKKSNVTGFVEFDSETEAKAALKFNGHKFSTDGDEVGIEITMSTKFKHLPTDFNVDVVEKAHPAAKKRSTSRSRSPVRRNRNGGDAVGAGGGEGASTGGGHGNALALSEDGDNRSDAGDSDDGRSDRRGSTRGGDSEHKSSQDADARAKAAEADEAKASPGDVPDTYKLPYADTLTSLQDEYRTKLPADAKRTLCVQNVPLPPVVDNASERLMERELSQVFRVFQGYEDVSLVVIPQPPPSAPTLKCFVQFRSAFEAALCRAATQGYKLYPRDKDKAGIEVTFAGNRTAQDMAVELGGRRRKRRKPRKRRRAGSRSRSPGRAGGFDRGAPRPRRGGSPPRGGFDRDYRDYGGYGRDMSRERRDRDRGRGWGGPEYGRDGRDSRDYPPMRMAPPPMLYPNDRPPYGDYAAPPPRGPRGRSPPRGRGRSPGRYR